MSKEEQLFNYYYKLQSQEVREDIQNWEPLKMKNTKTAIKINFLDGSWLRVYHKLNGTVEWY